MCSGIHRLCVAAVFTAYVVYALSQRYAPLSSAAVVTAIGVVICVIAKFVCIPKPLRLRSCMLSAAVCCRNHGPVAGQLAAAVPVHPEEVNGRLPRHRPGEQLRLREDCCSCRQTARRPAAACDSATKGIMEFCTHWCFVEFVVRLVGLMGLATARCKRLVWRHLESWPVQQEQRRCSGEQGQCCRRHRSPGGAEEQEVLARADHEPASRKPSGLGHGSQVARTRACS